MTEYIDKDKTLKELLDWCTIYGYGGLSTNDIKRIFRDNISNVKGEWVPGREICRHMLGDGTLAIEYDDFSCSICNFKFDRLIYNVYDKCIFKFCPNCGAYMEGDTND